MKKLTLLFFALACGLGACKKNNGDIDSLQQYIPIYDNLSANQNVAIDPFNIAYRYHLYREGGATQTLKNELFPHATIFESADGQNDTLRFTEAPTQPTNDYVRAGEIVIHTYGTSLAAENAVWQVTANNPNIGFYVYYPEKGYSNLSIDKNEYRISNVSENRFRVQADAIYLTSFYLGTVWNWDLDLIVTRTQGTGSNLSGSRFEIEAGTPPSAGGGFNMTDAARYRYEILDPLLYATDCGYMVKSGGTERIIRTDMKDYGGLDSLLFDFGQNYDGCTPGFSLSVREEADSTWTTHHYGPNGEWLD